MDPLTMALIGSAIATVVGSSISGGLNYSAQKQANATNVELANTAHQREVSDLQAAGLNPWLSASSSGAGGQVVANTAAGNAVSSATSDLAHMMSSLVNMKMLESMNSARNETRLVTTGMNNSTAREIAANKKAPITNINNYLKEYSSKSSNSAHKVEKRDNSYRAQLDKMSDEEIQKEWDKLLKELGK